MSELAGRATDLEERELAIGSHDRQALASFFDKLGSSWELQSEQVHTEKNKNVASATETLARNDQALGVASFRMKDAQAYAEKLEHEAQQARNAIAISGADDPADVVGDAERELGAIGTKRAALETELVSIDSEATHALAVPEACRT